MSSTTQNVDRAALIRMVLAGRYEADRFALRDRYLGTEGVMLERDISTYRAEQILLTDEFGAEVKAAWGHKPDFMDRPQPVGRKTLLGILKMLGEPGIEKRAKEARAKRDAAQAEIYRENQIYSVAESLLEAIRRADGLTGKAGFFDVEMIQRQLDTLTRASARTARVVADRMDPAAR